MSSARQVQFVTGKQNRTFREGFIKISSAFVAVESTAIDRGDLRAQVSGGQRLMEKSPENVQLIGQILFEKRTAKSVSIRRYIE